MDEVQDTKTILGTYSINWMCTTTERSEPTDGRIEIVPTQHKSDGSGWLPHEHTSDESTTDLEEDLLINTSADGSEDSSASSTDETPNTEDPATAEISWNIPCIAHFYWGAWEATFYCTYNIHNHSFPPPEDGLYPFAIQAMNEWMEMSLLGHPVTVPRIVCGQPDDHGHDSLRFEITWRRQGSGASTSRLYAKRVTGEGDWELSEAECQRLGIVENTNNTQFSVPQEASSQFPNTRLAGNYNGEHNRGRGRASRGTPRGRGAVSGASTSRGVFGGRGTPSGRGLFRERSRGRGSRCRGPGRGGSRGRA